MSEDKSLEQIFEEGAMQYFKVNFENRDFQGILDLFGKEVTGFGTGKDEVAYSSERSIELFLRDIDTHPQPVEYKFTRKKIIPITDTVAVFICNFSITFQTGIKKQVIEDTRQTLLLSLNDGKVKIEHLHVSVPDKDHIVGDSYPLGIIEDITKVIEAKVTQKTLTIMEAYRELEKVAVIDKVTQVFNRNRLDDLLMIEINRAFRYKKVFSLILIDLDYFKEINDHFGHLFGDQVLFQVSDVLKRSLRETDYIGRWGGDELLIILPEIALNDAMDIADTLCHKINHLQFDNHANISISMGVTSYQEQDTIETLFKRIDKALYTAKAKGRNQVVSAKA